jgi:energy-coupling factor transport system ATP-binding protein
MARVKLDKVTYSYPGQSRPAVADVSLQFEAGEAVAVMGANGGGKSTLARLIAGLISPDEGDVQVEYEGPAPRPVGILFQNPDNQMVAVTVEKEIAFGLENIAMSPADMAVRIAATLDRFGMNHLRQRLTSELSGGEKQRVALGAIMVFEAPILVLDEPDSYLDVEGRRSLRAELDRLRSQYPGLIEIRVTQYPEVARKYPRMLVMHEGSLAADSAPAGIFARTGDCLNWGISYAPANAAPGDLAAYTQSRESESAVSRIRLKEIDFTWPPDHTVLRSLDLELERGRIVGVVGPSGSGKTTLGHLVCRLLTPSAGTVQYLDCQGEPVLQPRIAGQVSGVFQQPERQFFLSTCAEEIRFGPGNLGWALSDEQVRTHLEQVGLPYERFANRDPFSLSGGEKRRLAFAAVLAMEPRFVVFDEPTCGLDQEGVGRFVHLAGTLRSQGVGMLVISHDGALLKLLADHILSLDRSGFGQLQPAEQFWADSRSSRLVALPE